MTELAHIYLGNILSNEKLGKRIISEPYLEVSLSPTDKGKGRIHTQTHCGLEIGIIKSRDWSLQEGDVLKTIQGQLILIHLQPQKVMVLSFTQLMCDSPLSLIHLGHTLGNHHWPIIVQDNKIYVQLSLDESVIEHTISHFKIPGLIIDYEWRLSDQILNFTEVNHHDQDG
ncbi:urease accessory protein UreE [Aphanothece sacrum]|uniref:Urease accessory protein UreE n=1 Tax=Aphanothece sacrum FPU1 TaxID=1920663 RepID=A0A401IKN3_APHSA|nr:urease accessory protein UreE [Aphanothece sacrum]GBF81760.1 urease accessory protein UreE [Aphanothece sacrum FPU1]GBF85118.1 urease accessory protein UreE [Aphanothece sacrum FPU3]